MFKKLLVGAALTVSNILAMDQVLPEQTASDPALGELISQKWNQLLGKEPKVKTQPELQQDDLESYFMGVKP